MQTEHELNTEFALQQQLHFEAHASGIVMAVIDNQYGKAVISTYGGHIVSYLPKGETEDVFFLSEKAEYGKGKAIRGGTPVCWPWFADDTSGFGRPAHGFARRLLWQVMATQAHDDGSTTIQLGLMSDETTLAVWPHAFELMMEITVGESLTLALTTKNVGEKAMEISQALHTYFNISDTTKISIQDLDNVPYLNKLKDFSQEQEDEEITVQGEIDRIYFDVPKTVRLFDEGFGREIVIDGQGSNTTVVWNPGPETIKSLSDMIANAYQAFICIETANAAKDLITLEQGQSHCLKARYQVKKR